MCSSPRCQIEVNVLLECPISRLCKSTCARVLEANKADRHAINKINFYNPPKSLSLDYHYKNATNPERKVLKSGPC